MFYALEQQAIRNKINNQKSTIINESTIKDLQINN